MENRVGRRQKPRFDVEVTGVIRTGAGKPLAAEITDLSEDGCACAVGSLWLKDNMHISVRIGALGPIESTIRWVGDRQVGLQFHQPLYGPVFEHLRDLIERAKAKHGRRAPRDISLHAMADRAAQTPTPR